MTNNRDYSFYKKIVRIHLIVVNVYVYDFFSVGPVLFPPGPPPNSADSSGVIVGASGYGFVPPSAGNSYTRF